MRVACTAGVGAKGFGRRPVVILKQNANGLEQLTKEESGQELEKISGKLRAVFQAYDKNRLEGHNPAEGEQQPLRDSDWIRVEGQKEGLMCCLLGA